MSDPVNMARTARERLAQALGALQSPGVPSGLLDVAEPIAQAMRALHQIEASGGAAKAQHGPTALDGVRKALGLLQADTSQHQAVQQAIESVAGSLGMVHGLAGPAPQAAAAPAPAAPAAFPAQAQYAAPPATQPSSALRAVPAPMQQPAPAYQQPAPAYQQPAPGPTRRSTPPAAPPAGAYAAAPQQPAPQAPQAGGGALGRVNAELGVHSATNFYKGLSGNDLFESGGIFIATYQIPPIGRELLIHVSMPGGYEFDAKGVVRWTREAPMSSAGGVEAPPGFGAQFTEISAEGKQLIQRYVRNREPLFHDDF
jgi:hypothetical protein